VTVQAGGVYLPGNRKGTPLTPERLRTADFSRAPLGRRGYNEDEVRRFLSRVAEDVGHADIELSRLRAEVERLRNYYRDAGVNVDSRSSRPAPSAQAVAMMSQAQQSADAQIAQAEEFAKQLVATARQRYEEIVQQARFQAAQAADEAARTHRPGAHGTFDEQEHLERRIAWLRMFAQVTEVQLKSALEALTREVDKLGELPVRNAPG
jgi:cell division initiation protein